MTPATNLENVTHPIFIFSMEPVESTVEGEERKWEKTSGFKKKWAGWRGPILP